MSFDRGYVIAKLGLPWSKVKQAERCASALALFDQTALRLMLKQLKLSATSTYLAMLFTMLDNRKSNTMLVCRAVPCHHKSRVAKI